MKNRIVSILLVLSLLAGLVPGVFAQEPNTAPFVIEPIEVYPAERSPEDKIGSVSRIEAAPGTDSQASTWYLDLSFLLYDSGSPDTYFTIKIYKGSSASGYPVMEAAGKFLGERGFYATSMGWSVSQQKPGTYLLVMSSAKMSGGKLVTISGTTSTKKLYVVEDYIKLQSMKLVDYDSRKEVKEIALRGDEVGYVEMVLSPTKNTHRREFMFEGSYGCLKIEQVGCLLILAPVSYGWAFFTVKSDYTEYAKLEVEICVNKGGHINQQAFEIAPVEEDMEGAILHYCPDCGSSYLEEIPVPGAGFGQMVDVPQDAWFYESVAAAFRKGLFTGVSPHHFNPDDSMTRAMLVTVLWRYAGQPAAGKSAFKDVKEGQWYTQAVTWAAENGIVGGVGNGRFDPNGKVTREQMAAILHRYAKKEGLDVFAPGAVLDSFPDLSKVSSYAVEPLRWAVHQGIIGGSKQGSQLLLDPQGSATRAQVAAILTRFIEKYYPVIYPVPEQEGAEEYGKVRKLTWAFYPDGTLTVGGDSRMPDFGPWSAQEKCPWEHLKSKITKVVVLDGVKRIGLTAFENCTNLKEVELPSSLRFVRASAFAYCTSLEKIALPEGTRHLNGHIFEGCTSLKEVYLPNSLYRKNFPNDGQYYGGGLFKGCTSLETVTLPMAWDVVDDEMFADCTNLKEVKFGIGLTSVHFEAFRDCSSLESMVFPFTVRVIEDGAFSGCTNLKDLVFLSPLASTQMHYSGKYVEPFGIRGTTTVYAYSFTKVAQLAQAEGYDFVPLDG